MSKMLDEIRRRVAERATRNEPPDVSGLYSIELTLSEAGALESELGPSVQAKGTPPAAPQGFRWVADVDGARVFAPGQSGVPDDHRLHRPGMEPIGESPAERAPGHGVFREGETPALLFATWLACGLSTAGVQLLCVRAGIPAERANAISAAFKAAGGFQTDTERFLHWG